MAFVKAFLLEHDYSPSIPEIAADTGLAYSTVHGHIRVLCDRGILVQTEHRSRSLRVARGKRKRTNAKRAAPPDGTPHSAGDPGDGAGS